MTLHTIDPGEVPGYSGPMEQTLKFFFVLFLLSFSALAGNFKELDLVARESLEEYFSSRNQVLTQIQFGSLTQLTEDPSDYLLEADVLAKGSQGQGPISYHCGIFLNRPTSRSWEIEVTVCEVNSPSAARK